MTRAKLSRFRADAKDVDEVERERGSVVREHLSCAGEVNGITIAPGNPIMCRLYDKTVELRLPGREEKLKLEHELWGDAVAPGDSVTRVELQLRGEALDQLAMRDPTRLAPYEATLERFREMLRDVFLNERTSMTKSYLRFLVDRIDVAPLSGRSIELNIVGKAGAAIQLMASSRHEKPHGGGRGVCSVDPWVAGPESTNPVLGSVDSWLGKRDSNRARRADRAGPGRRGRPRRSVTCS